MLRNVLLTTLIATSLNAQCWHPLGGSPMDSSWLICHGQALPGNGWTHRFDWSQMTPQQQALAQAIAMVEQGLHDPSLLRPSTANARGDNGDAVGPFQIWSPFFSDARQYEPKLAPDNGAYPYHLEGHCWDDTQEPLVQQMYEWFWWCNNCGAWYAWHMRYGFNDMMNMDATAAERIARKHNGGPNGHNVDATEKYWNKVKERLQNHFPGVIPGI